MASYRDLQIYRESFDLFIETHRLSMRLPKHELYELGSQLRRSSDSVNSNIVEGYGRSQYKKEFIRFLSISIGSCDETVAHLRKLAVLYPDLTPAFQQLATQYQHLGGKIRNFQKYVRANWRTAA